MERTDITVPAPRSYRHYPWTPIVLALIRSQSDFSRGESQTAESEHACHVIVTLICMNAPHCLTELSSVLKHLDNLNDAFILRESRVCLYPF